MTRIHLTPDGPKPCTVDPTNPNSKGCKYGEENHYSNWTEAGVAYDALMVDKHGSFNTLEKEDLDKLTEQYYAETDLEEWTPELVDEFLEYEEAQYLAERDAVSDIETWTPELIEEFLMEEENKYS